MEESHRCPHAVSAGADRQVRESPIDQSDQNDRLSLVAYERNGPVENALHRMPPKRNWMEATSKKGAYRCLPLVVANQAGWVIRNPFTFQALWDGGPELDQIRFAFPEGPVGWEGQEAKEVVCSHFGSGIITIHMPYLFRTSPGYNLWVKGPANSFKDGVQALEGMVETDWSHAPFTMNWKITRPHHPILFREGEPLCQILPYPRGLVERFDPEIRHLSTNPALSEGFEGWVAGRAGFLKDLADPQSEAHKEGWQKQYFQGRDASGRKVDDHQTAIPIRDFARVHPANQSQST